MPTEMRSRNDVAIVGGGPAGSAAAIYLARRGATVIVVAGRLPATNGTLGSGEHVSPDVAAAITALGAVGALEASEPSPGRVSLWDGPQPVVGTSVWSPLGGGRTVDRAAFDDALLASAGRAGARILDGHRVVATKWHRDGWRLRAIGPRGEEESLRAGYLLDATGGAATIARAAGSRVVRADRLVGIVARTPPAPEAAAALQMLHLEAIDGGWWYAAALPDASVVAGYVTPHDGAAAGLNGRSGTAWRQALARSRLVGPILARDPAAARASIRRLAASPGITQPPAGQGWLAIGDAAVRWDPLEGRGVRYAIETGLRGAEVALLPAHDREPVVRAYAATLRQRLDEHLSIRQALYAAARDRLGERFIAAVGGADRRQSPVGGSR